MVEIEVSARVEVCHDFARGRDHLRNPEHKKAHRLTGFRVLGVIGFPRGVGANTGARCSS